MTVAKITEISSTSPVSFEDAIKKGVARASQTLHGLKGAWVSEQKVKIEGDKIVEYQVILRLTFVLD
ncbi:MAG: dodecin domain-containing protein [Acidobacteria bacterium]|jgi:hypothetical protein|nr:dodecin domain-containing protein [Thermoanaerobaculia bacterium]MDI9632086.1 dodecin family protein [Acidobacteriota bacterium]OQC36065.1 MAG: hypothetical protein BWX64_02222 [Acidobacteria bacterium ADurb.Bin051]MBP7814329.1 dodecin domain-containing protein [Thermoanaerobaculia bacterium]MBP8845765.1 dodecin domain-containing protein [Thermoanaerobaculia bacterium]